MRKPNILLGLTGSVASILAIKLVERLQLIGNVVVVMTERSKSFVDPSLLRLSIKTTDDDVWGIYGDDDEWKSDTWTRDEEILHIKLRKWADVMVVAPLSANTLAKMSHGICDNLLTSVFRAWDFTKPCVMAPAMNTMMWEHPLTRSQLHSMNYWFDFKEGGVYRNGFSNLRLVHPIEKTLACGDVGTGAMGDIEDIAAMVSMQTTWLFPLAFNSHGRKDHYVNPGIPRAVHPGMFGYKRSYYTNPGVDLYTTPRAPVTAVEAGIVVAIEPFTGPQLGTDHWNDTMAIMVEGRSGVACYGEVEPVAKVGQSVARGELVGYVIPVLADEKYRPDVPGHSTSMLHFELYEHGVRKPVDWALESEQPSQLIDPTDLLATSLLAPQTDLRMPQ